MRDVYMAKTPNVNTLTIFRPPSGNFFTSYTLTHTDAI